MKRLTQWLIAAAVVAMFFAVLAIWG